MLSSVGIRVVGGGVSPMTGVSTVLLGDRQGCGADLLGVQTGLVGWDSVRVEQIPCLLGSVRSEHNGHGAGVSHLCPWKE